MTVARYRKLVVAVVGLAVWVAAQVGLDIPAEQQANLVTVLLVAVSAGVWWVPNEGA